MILDSMPEMVSAVKELSISTGSNREEGRWKSNIDAPDMVPLKTVVN